VTVRFREGTDHDEILEVLDALPHRATSAWITHALLCYVRGEIRDVEQETRVIEEELAGDLFGMFEEDDDDGRVGVHGGSDTGRKGAREPGAL
jgi:hypothetical protein